MTASAGCAWCVGPHEMVALADRPLVSVVVTHYEQPGELARTLAALARQDTALHEVVVTDDGSAVLPTVPAGVRLLTQPDRGFRAALARNRGATQTTGDVVVFLDADTVPEPALVRHLVEAVAHAPDTLVVGRRRHTRFGLLDPSDPLAGAVAHELEEPAWLRDGYAASDGLRRADDGSFRFVISALLACSRAWFDRVGGFDETSVGYGGEDWELAHRWWTAGGRLLHEPAAVGWHHGDHAGAGERAAADSTARRTAETLGVARRVNAWPAAFRGLRSAPPAVVVTHDDVLDDRELLVSVDGLLADVPLAAVVSDRPVWRAVGDPRVRPVPGALDTRATWRVHLHRGVLADPGGWTTLLGRGSDGTVVRLVAGSGPVVSLTRLRALRRTHLGLEPLVTGDESLPPALRPLGRQSLAGWLGDWIAVDPAG